ncbi:Acg family FMN-binding oxidoreductase [Catenuloplanes atrovinosus]|uniref:Nitroreductase n=1 Tax=Catenuloplanes atrovinosus TaxID=137266 RepID=A0AAE4CAG7_9ACTN|nr:nitroreductase family protein [Catenuloplanes atrovinosus]MDR7276942.1 nitroreductase [Catenuloplanes atrovinosus]
MAPASAVIGALSPETLDACLAAAVAAPSVHNTQPWRFRVPGPEIEVLADDRRRLRVLDPAGRLLAISVGAAALNLRVAMRARGRLPVQRILPDRARPDALVAVLPGPFAPPGASVLGLAAAIGRRHTSRLPLETGAIPWRVQQDLLAAAAAEGARLTVCDPVTRDGLLALTRAAEETLRRDPVYRNEIAAWTGGPPSRADGVPAAAFAPEDSGHRLALRDFRLGHPELGRRMTARFERFPALMVLSTAGDTPYDWVRAGQALQRVLLTATVHGLVVTPMNQALDVPALRHLAGGDGDRRYAQVILRAGYGRPGPATPRRGLDEVLVSSA